MFYIYDLKIKVRSSCTEVFCKKGVLKRFVNFTGKHLRQSLFDENLENFWEKRSVLQKSQKLKSLNQFMIELIALA